MSVTYKKHYQSFAISDEKSCALFQTLCDLDEILNGSTSTTCSIMGILLNYEVKL